MTVKETQQSLNTTLEKTEQTLGGLEKSLGNNEEVSPLATAENSEANDGLPEGWFEVELDSISSDVSYGYTAKSNRNECGPHLLRITDIQNGSVNWSEVPFCEIDLDKESKYLIEKGDLLFARTGATVGKSFLVRTNPPKSVYASYLIRVRTLDKSGTNFLAHFFNSPLYWNQITELSTGIGQPNVNGTKLKELLIPLPPLAEQTVIAQTLDTLLAQVDNIKTRLDDIPNILKTFRQSVLAAAVSGKLTEEWRGENECGEWKQVTLGEVGKGFNYGSSSKSQKEGDVPVLRMGNLQSGKLDWGNLVYTSDPGEIEKYLLESGDVLFNRTNSPELVGKTSIYRGERKSIYAGYLIRVKGSGELNAEFLNILLNSPDAKAYCMAVKSDGVSQSNINARKLRAFSFRNPSIAEQSQIVHRVEELFAFADKIEQQVKNAQGRVNNLTQSILAKAFRGELTAQWRAENPDLISGENSAEVLLEQIKQEREALKQKAKPKKSVKKKAR